MNVGISLIDLETALFDYIDKADEVLEENLDTSTKAYKLKINNKQIKIIISPDVAYLIEC